MTEMSKAQIGRFLIQGTLTGCIDDQIPPFSFVTIFGTAKIHPYKQKEVFKWAKKIAERYMGKGNAEAYGGRNSEEGLVLEKYKVRISVKCCITVVKLIQSVLLKE